MYANTAEEVRPDLMEVMMEASAADRTFISEKLMPTHFVKTESGDYYKFEKGPGQLLSAEPSAATIRAPKQPYKELDRTWTKDGYTTVDRGLEEAVDDNDKAKVAPSFDAEEVISNLVLRNVRIGQEIRTANIIQDPAVWGSTDAGDDYTLANIGTFDVLDDLEGGVERVHALGEMVNTITMSRPVWRRVRASTKLRTAILGDKGGVITRALLGAYLSESVGENVMIEVGETTYTTKKKDKTVTIEDIHYAWSNSYIWIGCVQGGDYRLGGAGRTIVWEEVADQLYVIETYRDPKTRTDRLRVRQNSVEKVVNKAAGTLIKTNFA